MTPRHQSAPAVTAGEGTAEAAGVRVVGGLSTGFADVPVPDATLAAIRAVYVGATPGRDSPLSPATFLDLPNHARYPRAWFFDTQDHLHEDAQRLHAALVARALVAAGLTTVRGTPAPSVPAKPGGPRSCPR